MEALFAEAMKATQALRKTSVPWAADQPYNQPYYAYNPASSTWEPKTPTPSPTQDSTITKLVLYTWNIDFMLPFAAARMNPALTHLSSFLTTLPTSTAPIIFLQECTPSDLSTIASTPWIRSRFHITDLTHEFWATEHYGTTILLDARLPVLSAFRVHFSNTRMDRDAFFVDTRINNKTTRLCNSHLESMALDPPFRPPQVALIASYLHSPAINAGITAGDFNAIQPFDRTLHSENNLKDAFLELGGKEDTEEAYTWGQQAPIVLRERFGLSRMDKVFFTGAVNVSRYERFGGGVLVEGEEEKKEIVKLGFEEAWVTDHLGVFVEIKVDTDAEITGEGVRRESGL
ncbi:Endonuclease/exonuclease/phosphatase [Aspergillus karnatakaensis]|uniref:endonuclease/exonuclease/phosphatase family protein n=1 Tax=Aspergillus karnatakaensis TaxID=1810916 RepID=UPI003CCCA909